MENQLFEFEDFWARYGRSEFSETEFARALARLPKVAAGGPWVAGGSVRRLIARQAQESDFDFFFRDADQFEAFDKAMRKIGMVTAESDFNITYLVKSGKKKVDPELKVQAIRIAYFDDPNALIDSFDFSICQFAFDGDRLFCGQWSLFDLASKRLVPGRITYGTSSLRRLIKYTRQGFTVCGGGLANMLEQVANDPSLIQRDVEYVD